MIISQENEMTILKSSQPFKNLTNGTILTPIVYLGKNDSIDNWKETMEEEKDENEQDLHRE